MRDAEVTTQCVVCITREGKTTGSLSLAALTALEIHLSRAGARWSYFDDAAEEEDAALHLTGSTTFFFFSRLIHLSRCGEEAKLPKWRTHHAPALFSVSVSLSLSGNVGTLCFSLPARFHWNSYTDDIIISNSILPCATRYEKVKNADERCNVLSCAARGGGMSFGVVCAV